MSESTHDAILRVLALLLALLGLVWLIGSLDAPGVFAKLFGVLLGAFTLATAVGFWRKRGWAFLAVSVGLLVGFMRHFILFVASFDAGSEGSGLRAIVLVLNIALIGYLGRWSMERRFRPHLDADHH